jgi:hypothetical protein
MLYWPLVSTRALPRILPAELRIVIVAPERAVPVTTIVDAVCTHATVILEAEIVGAVVHPVAGETVIVTVFPAIVEPERVDSTLRVYVPTPRAGAITRDQLPFAPTVVVPRVAPDAFFTVMVAPAVPSPDTVVATVVAPQARV